MKRSVFETALLIALLFKRSGKTRAKISGLTIKKLSNRVQLRYAFVESLKDALDDWGLALIEIESGYSLIPWTVLNGAPAITAKKNLADVLKALKEGSTDFNKIQQELDVDDKWSDQDDDE